MADQLTIMAVHAHPDDEVISTGGVFARYAAEGIRTVLVTCTNGEQGDAPGGVEPGRPGHDPSTVRAQRLSELRESAALLGIEHVELLGSRDSGMDGWDANAAGHGRYRLRAAGRFRHADGSDHRGRGCGPLYPMPRS